MLQVTQLCGFGATLTGVDVTLADSYEDTGSSATTHTDAGKSLGAIGTDRKIIVAISGFRTTATAISITSVTVGGETAAVISDGVTSASQLEAGTRGIVAMYIIDAGAGSALAADTTATIEITFNGATFLYGCAIYRMTGAPSTTAHDVNNDNSGDPLTVSQDCEPGGAIIAAVENNYSSGNGTAFTGVTEDVETFGGGGSFAHAEFADLQTGLSVEADLTTASSQAMTVVSFSR